MSFPSEILNKQAYAGTITVLYAISQMYERLFFSLADIHVVHMVYSGEQNTMKEKQKVQV